MQWRNEIASHTDGLNVLVWHGASRQTEVKELKKYDVVSVTRLRILEWSLNQLLGVNNLCGFGELLPQAAERFQAQRYDC